MLNNTDDFITIGAFFWGSAFLATNIAFLTELHTSVSQSVGKVLVFACLAFCISVLGAALPLAGIGLFVGIYIFGYVMTIGFTITIVGLVARVSWNKYVSRSAL